MSNPSKIAVKEADGPNGEHTYHHRSKPAGSPYLSNVIVSGKTVYLAGCIGIGENNALVSGGVGPETTQALKEAAKRLAFIGLHLSDGKFWCPTGPAHWQLSALPSTSATMPRTFLVSRRWAGGL